MVTLSPLTSPERRGNHPNVITSPIAPNSATAEPSSLGSPERKFARRLSYQRRSTSSQSPPRMRRGRDVSNDASSLKEEKGEGDGYENESERQEEGSFLREDEAATGRLEVPSDKSGGTPGSLPMQTNGSFPPSTSEASRPSLILSPTNEFPPQLLASPDKMEPPTLLDSLPSPPSTFIQPTFTVTPDKEGSFDFVDRDLDAKPLAAASAISPALANAISPSSSSSTIGLGPPPNSSSVLGFGPLQQQQAQQYAQQRQPEQVLTQKRNETPLGKGKGKAVVTTPITPRPSIIPKNLSLRSSFTAESPFAKFVAPDERKMGNDDGDYAEYEIGTTPKRKERRGGMRTLSPESKPGMRHRSPSAETNGAPWVGENMSTKAGMKGPDLQLNRADLMPSNPLPLDEEAMGSAIYRFPENSESWKEIVGLERGSTEEGHGSEVPLSASTEISMTSSSGVASDGNGILASTNPFAAAGFGLTNLFTSSTVASSASSSASSLANGPNNNSHASAAAAAPSPGFSSKFKALPLSPKINLGGWGLLNVPTWTKSLSPKSLGRSKKEDDDEYEDPQTYYRRRRSVSPSGDSRPYPSIESVTRQESHDASWVHREGRGRRSTRGRSFGSRSLTPTRLSTTLSRGRSKRLWRKLRRRYLGGLAMLLMVFVVWRLTQWILVSYRHSSEQESLTTRPLNETNKGESYAERDWKDLSAEFWSLARWGGKPESKERTVSGSLSSRQKPQGVVDSEIESSTTTTDDGTLPFPYVPRPTEEDYHDGCTIPSYNPDPFFVQSLQVFHPRDIVPTRRIVLQPRPLADNQEWGIDGGDEGFSRWERWRDRIMKGRSSNGKGWNRGRVVEFFTHRNIFAHHNNRFLVESGVPDPFEFSGAPDSEASDREDTINTDLPISSRNLHPVSTPAIPPPPPPLSCSHHHIPHRPLPRFQIHDPATPLFPGSSRAGSYPVRPSEILHLRATGVMPHVKDRFRLWENFLHPETGVYIFAEGKRRSRKTGEEQTGRERWDEFVQWRRSIGRDPRLGSPKTGDIRVGWADEVPGMAGELNEWKLRWFYMLRAAWKEGVGKREGLKWYVLADTDSFFLDGRMIHDMLSRYDSRKDWELGQPGERETYRSEKWTYAYGGAGMFLSRGVVEKMMARWDECWKKFSTRPIWGGDLMISACVALVMAPPSYEPPSPLGSQPDYVPYLRESLTLIPALHQFQFHGPADGLLQYGRQIWNLHHWLIWIGVWPNWHLPGWPITDEEDSPVKEMNLEKSGNILDHTRPRISSEEKERLRSWKEESLLLLGRAAKSLGGKEMFRRYVFDGGRAILTNGYSLTFYPEEPYPDLDRFKPRDTQGSSIREERRRRGEGGLTEEDLGKVEKTWTSNENHLWAGRYPKRPKLEEGKGKRNYWLADVREINNRFTIFRYTNSFPGRTSDSIEIVWDRSLLPDEETP